jgi:hypothetical protein
MDSLKLAQGLRGWQQKHPGLDLAAGFVPLAGQAYGLASSAAAMRDPEASKLEKGLAVAGILPVGKAAGALKKIIVGEKTVKGVPALEASLAMAKKLRNQFFKAGKNPSKGARGMTDLVQGDPRINDQLAKETGWWIDPDSGKWMHELDDSRASPDYPFLDQAKNNQMMGPMKGGGHNAVGLEDALPHPELAKLPEGRRMMSEVSVTHDPTDVGRGGKYSPMDDEITFGAPIDPNPKNMSDVRDTLLHETQHGIASREGFPIGTNPEAAGSYETYLKDPGEMTARMVSLRRNMTPDARRRFPMHRQIEEERFRLMDPLQQRRYQNDEDLKRALKLRNLDPDEMLVPGP